jgi:hypothetical protein
MSATPFVIPFQPSVNPENKAERRAVIPATTHIFDWTSSMKDLKKPLAIGEGFLFLPNTLILRFKSLSSPIMPLLG